MKYQKHREMGTVNFLLDNNHFVYDYRENEDSLHIYVKSRPHDCCCPICGAKSRQLHATYQRTLQDTPIHCKKTILHLEVYEYNCLNPQCGCKVFAEELPFAKKHQTRTDALTAMILGIAMFLSNECASQILALLGVSCSNDTIRRIYDRIEFIDNPNVEAVGIDDVAIRKGQTYATAIYDLHDHHLIALLEGRDGKTLKEWLKQHKKIRLVTRDRASAYAAAISEILPDCVQVADRFHLLQNLLERLKDIFKEEMPSEIFIQDGHILEHAPQKVLAVKQPPEESLAALDYDNTPPQNPDGTVVAFDNKRRRLDSPAYLTHAEGRKEKQDLIRRVQQRWEQLEKKRIKTISEEFHIVAATAKKYITMTEAAIQSLDQPTNYKKRKTVMDDYLNMIYKMLRDGVNDALIYCYIQYKGYKGSANTLWEYIHCIERNNFPQRKPANPTWLKEKHYPEEVIVIKRSSLLKYLMTVNPKTKKDKTIAQHIEIIKERYPIAEKVQTMFQEFHETLMGKQPDKLGDFLQRYEDSEIAGFCTSIKKDIAPVMNAISFEASSGFVEGNNNKFKLIKRIVYGRPHLVNLSKKCLLAFSLKDPDLNLFDLI